MINVKSIIFISPMALPVWFSDLSACTTFCLKGNHQVVLCKDLDWDFRGSELFLDNISCSGQQADSQRTSVDTISRVIPP